MKLMVYLNCDEDILFDFCDLALNYLRDTYDLGPEWEISVTTDGVVSNTIIFKSKEVKADLKIKGRECEINFINYDMKPLVYHLIAHGFLNGWYELDASKYINPEDVSILLGDVLGLQKISKNIKNDKPKLFISCPMNDCNSKKEVTDRLDVLSRIAKYLLKKDFEVINTWIDEEPPKDVKNQRAWYAGKSLELLSEADYYLGIKDLPQKFYGCHIENYTAKTLNIKSSYIDYNLFKLFDTAEITKILDINIHYIDPFVEASYD